MERGRKVLGEEGDGGGQAVVSVVSGESGQVDGRISSPTGQSLRTEVAAALSVPIRPNYAPLRSLEKGTPARAFRCIECNES